MYFLIVVSHTTFKNTEDMQEMSLLNQRSHVEVRGECNLPFSSLCWKCGNKSVLGIGTNNKLC